MRISCASSAEGMPSAGGAGSDAAPIYCDALLSMSIQDLLWIPAGTLSSAYFTHSCSRAPR